MENDTHWKSEHMRLQMAAGHTTSMTGAHPVGRGQGGHERVLEALGAVGRA